LTDNQKEELQGITLQVYLYAVKKGKPIGPRDTMKNISLSSPSVAYRHLQKLEDMGYLQKNEYGEYIIKGKAQIEGNVWLRNLLVPKMWVYSLIFLAILSVEVVVLAIHYSVETYEFKVFFILIVIITLSALAVFSIEGFLLRKQRNKKISE
jgi:hypothetical protein